MNIMLNGDKVSFDGELTVKKLLKLKDFIFPLLVIRINGNLVERDDYENKVVRNGDTVDVLHLLSGG